MQNIEKKLSVSCPLTVLDERQMEFLLGLYRIIMEVSKPLHMVQTEAILSTNLKPIHHINIICAAVKRNKLLAIHSQT